MLSEEDIKKVEYFLKNEINGFAPPERQAFQNLLQGYKELKNENEDLKNLANNKQWISPCYVAQNYIPKSVVEEKLQETDKMIEKISKGELQRYTVGELLLIKRVLEELLKGDK